MLFYLSTHLFRCNSLRAHLVFLFDIYDVIDVLQLYCHPFLVDHFIMYNIYIKCKKV